jgi:hypothetical protein
MQIMVRDNNVDQALRALKKKLQREGVYRVKRQPLCAAPARWTASGWNATGPSKARVFRHVIPFRKLSV